jgi:hypothetical protein
MTDWYGALWGEADRDEAGAGRVAGESARDRGSRQLWKLEAAHPVDRRDAEGEEGGERGKRVACQADHQAAVGDMK